MQVVDQEPHAWFLLRDDAGTYLDVNCSHGPVGYSVLLELDDDERRALDEGGRSYLDDLAATVAYRVRSPYRDRDLTRARGHEVTAAVAAWRSGGATD
ncbi:hypothetical protein GCM10009772_06740 [Pseudonocardia alni subsp. carboxydivorans]